MEPEICTVTGGEAFASFDGGFGYAWYGSDHDTSLMVDLSSTLSGPVCDEVLGKAIERGDVVVYGSQMSGLRKPSEVGVAAATALFLRGVTAQQADIDEPPAASLRSITRTMGGVTGINRADDKLILVAPVWQATVWKVAGGGTQQSASRDFEHLGRLWALASASARAFGRPPFERGLDDPKAAAEASFAFAFEVEQAEARAAEIEWTLVDGLDAHKTDHSFDILLRMPAEGTKEEYDTRFAAIVEALGMVGCNDATVSTTGGEGLVRLDFTRRGHGSHDAVGSALNSVGLALCHLGNGHRIERVEFRGEG